MIEVKRNNEVIFSTPINEGCLRRCTLMQEDYVTLKFNLTTPIYFKLGDSIMDGAFEIVDLTAPTYNENTRAYEYEVRFDAYYWKWKNKKFFYSPEHGAREAVWNLTADLPSQLKVFLRNLKHLGYNYNGQEFEFVVEGVGNKSISMHYDSVNLIDALTMLAEEWECEWWITDNVIHFGRCEYGTPIDFKLNDNVQEMIRNDGQQNYATRIYAFGSARNIPRDYRPHSDEVAINGIADKRLMMPEGTPYVDAYPGMSQEEAVEQVVIFDDIYPSRVNEVTEVREKEGSTTEEGITTNFWTYWIKDKSLNFKIEYILPNEELRITFQSGALNGMDFALGYNEKSNEFEIIRNENYGRLLPDSILKPKIGDKFVLYGYDTKFIDDQLLPEAEQRLKERAIEYIEKIKIDPSTYENRMMSDFMYNNGEVRAFELGDKVNLINPTYFEEGRVSRIIGYEYLLDKPYDNPIYYVGETASYSLLNDLEDKVDELIYKDQIFQSTQGKGVYVVGQYDSTKPTDRNVLSSLRALNTFLRKDQADKTEHLITFLAGLNLGTKYSIDKNGNASLNDIKANVVEGITALFNQIEATQLNATQADINNLTAFTLLVKSLADVGNLNVKDTATILNAVVKQSLTSPKFVSGFLGEGFRLAKTESGDWNLEIDNLTVRKVFQVFELLIQEVKHQGGVVVHSPAGGKITKVTDGGSYWRCEIESADAFVKDDLVLCQKFTGKVKRYWRAVTSAGDGYINLSKTDCEPNSAIPEEGDEIATLGNKTNTTRQSAYLISVVGADAPYTAYYSGINSYSLKGKEHTRIGNLEGVVSPVFGPLKGSGAVLENAYVQGMIKLQNGKSVETVISETSSKLSSDIGKVQTDLQKDINTSVSSVKNELGATITNVENNFNANLSSTKNELNSSISKAQGDADTAKGLAQSAQDSIDGLEVGVKNLIVDSKSIGFAWTSPGTITWTNNKEWARTSLPFPSPIISEMGTGRTVNVREMQGVELVMSVLVRTDASSLEGWFTYYGDVVGHMRVPTKFQKIGDNLYRMYGVGKIRAKQYNLRVCNIHSFKAEGGSYIEFAYMKLEQGNKPTDWTPAPEDTEAQINAVQKEIKDVEQRFEIADGQINSHIKETTQLVNEAKNANGESIKTLEQVKVQINDINVTAGQINTTLGEVTKKQGEINSSISNLEQTAGSFKTEIEGFKETEQQIKATANKIEATHAGIVLEASEKSAKKAIDGLEIGGRNLLLDSNKGWVNSSYPTARLVFSEPLKEGERFYVRIYGKLNENSSNDWHIYNSGGIVNVIIVPRSSYNKVGGYYEAVGKWRVASASNKSAWIYGIPNSKLENIIDKVIISRGNKPTDWTPAPEDTEAQFTETNAKLGVLNDQLLAEVSKTDGISKDLAAVKLDHNSFKVQVKTDITGAINANNEVIKSSFEMKDNKISLLGAEIDITGKVTFRALDTATQSQINTAGSTANTALSNAGKAQTSADTANSSITALKGSLGGLAYEDRVELAKLGTTVIEGGFLKTDLIQANSIKAEKLDIKSLEAVRIRTGNLEVTAGAKIGEYSIDNKGLYYGDTTKWGDENYKQNTTHIVPGEFRMQKQRSYFQPGDISLVKVGLGDNADPKLYKEGVDDKFGYTAAYFYRQMVPNVGDKYYPAVQIISDNAANADVALFTDGTIYSKQGVINGAKFLNLTTDYNVLGAADGELFVVTSNANYTLYLPRKSDIELFMRQFNLTELAYPIEIVCADYSNYFIYVRFAEGDSTKGMINYNGTQWGNSIRKMARGDNLRLLLIYRNREYYAQLLSYAE